MKVMLENFLSSLLLMLPLSLAMAFDVVVVDNGATDVILADAADVVAVDTDTVVVVAAFVVVVTDGAAVVVVGATVVVVGSAFVVVAVNKQIRLVVRLPLNKMYSLLLHCSQFVQLVP